MVGKNNWEVQMKRGANKVKRYTIKRTSVGVVSAVVAAGLIFGQETSVQADEVTGAESQTTEVSSEESTETEESVEEVSPVETSQVEATAEENGTVSEIDAEELSEPVYEQTEIVAEEVAIEAETIVADTEAVQEVAEVSEESLDKTEEEASVQPQMSALAATANVSNEDTQLPELISISTDKDVYQAGEDIKVTAIVSENVSLDHVAAMFSRADDSETGPVGFTGTSSQFIQQSDGTYLVEMIIPTDEKIPSNTYELWNVSMSDSSGNTETVIWNNDPNNLLGLQFNIVARDVDTQLPELISISTDKDVYQAGEDIKVTAIVSENVSLDHVAAMFSRADDSETGPVGFTGTSSQFIQQSDGTYLVEMIIPTDEKIPSNTYELWNVSMSDSSGNTETLIWNNDPNNLLGLQFDIMFGGSGTTIDPEVPEVEEPETPVEPEVPEVEEPETPVEPEVPEV
ncbi:YSIRK-type signal peptide-containing protein, partial [Aerococcus viridans]|uniref:YSIRK-type signal peptide-containing protein n=1 Tax=Aerococcus viridans TaxID=1377 RepID=UPI003B21D670